MNLDKNRTRTVISLIFSFILSIIFFLLYVFGGLSIGLFREETILNKVNESNYYNKVEIKTNENAKILIEDAGFPASTLDQVITLKRVYISGQNYIRSALEGKESLVDTQSIKADLLRNIYAYLNGKGITLTKELETGIGEIIAKVEKEYQRSIRLQFINYIAEYKIQFHHIAKIVVPILLLLVAVLCIFLIKMQKYVHQGVRYIVYAVMSSTLMNALITLFLLLTKRYQRMEAAPDYYYDFLVSFYKWNIEVFLYLAAMGAMVSVLLIMLMRYLKNRVLGKQKAESR